MFEPTEPKAWNIPTGGRDCENVSLAFRMRFPGRDMEAWDFAVFERTGGVAAGTSSGAAGVDIAMAQDSELSETDKRVEVASTSAPIELQLNWSPKTEVS